MATGYAGTYRGTIVNDADPMQQNRLQVVVPDVFGDAPVWAQASLSPGTSEPTPPVGEDVWVSFEHGDTEYPVWAREEGGDHAKAGYVGVYRGVVVTNDDPLQEHRLEVTVPEVDPTPAWARPASDVADADVPEVGTEVWVEYDSGDPAYPRWVGLA